MLTDFQILHHGPGQEDAAWPYECQLYFGREIEKDVRAEDAKVIRQLVEALLAQEQHRWRESPEPEQPAAHRGGFSLPAEGGPNGSSIAV